MNSNEGLGRVRGVALYISAILGGGLLVLPALSYRLGGPASIIAWLALIVASIPVALTFESLGSVIKSSGGVGGFAKEAFGDRVGRATSLCFIIALPPGAAAGSLVGATYFTQGLNLSESWVLPCSLLLLSTACGVVSLGIKVSTGLQVAMSLILGLTLLVSIGGALPAARISNIHPWMPHGLHGVTSSMGLLFFSFAGWEAVAPLFYQFRDPERDIRFVTRITLGVVGGLYFLLSLTTILVLGPKMLKSSTPVADLLSHSLGTGSSRLLTGVLAATLTVGTMCTYFVGGSVMISDLDRDRSISRHLSTRLMSLGIPIVGILALWAISIMFLFIVWLNIIDLTAVMNIASSLFVFVTIIGLASSWRVLDVPVYRYLGFVSAALLTCVLLSCGWVALLPFCFFAIFSFYRSSYPKSIP